MVIQQEIAVTTESMAYFGNVTHLPIESFHMELYSIVLSVSMLSLSFVFGSGGNLAMLISLCSSKLIKRFRYIYIVVLLIFSCLFDLVWCPMEIARLLWGHQQEPSMLQKENFEITGQTVYIFLMCTIGCSLLLISTHATLEILDRSNHMTNRSVNIVLLLASFVLCLGFSLAYCLTTLYRDKKHINHFGYYNAFLLKVLICTAWLLVLSLMVVIILMIYRRRGHWAKRKESMSELSEPLTPLNIPTLLIKEVDDSSDIEDMDAKKEPDKNSSHKMMYLQDKPAKEDNTSTVGELPSPSRTKNHLGVNMAAILGRRRHTIGQIGETGLDIIQKAKQYNYVRKFSVDINALQAQLENPKIHAEFPFRSDTELQKTDKPEKERPIKIKSPPTPLLHLKLKENQIEHIKEDEEDKYNSDDDAVAAADDDEVESKQSSPESLLVNPPTELDGLKALDTLRLSQNQPADIDYDGDRYSFKLAILLILTFICCVLPMYITETVLEHLSKNAYINILTCTMALSVVQTIIYPQIIFCMDTSVNDTVNKVFSRFRGQFMHMCYGQQQVPTSEQSDISVSRV